MNIAHHFLTQYVERFSVPALCDLLCVFFGELISFMHQLSGYNLMHLKQTNKTEAIFNKASFLYSPERLASSRWDLKALAYSNILVQLK